MNIHAAIELINNEDLVFDQGEWKVKIPEYLIKIIKTGAPARLLKVLVDNYPEALPYIVKNEPIPIALIDAY